MGKRQVLQVKVSEGPADTEGTRIGSRLRESDAEDF